MLPSFASLYIAHSLTRVLLLLVVDCIYEVALDDCIIEHNKSFLDKEPGNRIVWILPIFRYACGENNRHALHTSMDAPCT